MKTTVIFSLFFLFFTFILFDSCFAGTNINTWRCGENVISIGDSKTSILFKCGPPTVKNVTGSETTGSFKSKPKGDISRGAYEETTQLIEEWVYNCGDGKFNTYLTFKNSVLISILRGDYGSGESYCEGADENPKNNQEDK